MKTLTKLHGFEIEFSLIANMLIPNNAMYQQLLYIHFNLQEAQNLVEI